MSRTTVKPYLLTKDDDGVFHVTIRTTRFNSQGYPLVNTQLLDQTFPSAARARSYLRAEYKAETVDIATK